MTHEYEIGRWYKHDGGPCPVPGRALVYRVYDDGSARKLPPILADGVDWPRVIFFCVTECPPQEETRSGKCWARDYAGAFPVFYPGSDLSDFGAFGPYTVTIIDGKPTRIVWEADQ